jgi:hypothetical protein
MEETAALWCATLPRMRYEEIDRESATAPYKQIAADLRAKIRAGEYQPGQRLARTPVFVRLGTGQTGTLMSIYAPGHGAA